MESKYIRNLKDEKDVPSEVELHGYDLEGGEIQRNLGYLFPLVISNTDDIQSSGSVIIFKHVCEHRFLQRNFTSCKTKISRGSFCLQGATHVLMMD